MNIRYRIIKKIRKTQSLLEEMQTENSEGLSYAATDEINGLITKAKEKAFIMLQSAQKKVDSENSIPKQIILLAEISNCLVLIKQKAIIISLLNIITKTLKTIWNLRQLLLVNSGYQYET